MANHVRDRDIRRALLKELDRAHAHERHQTLILDEMGVCEGEARIDVAVVNGSIAGYEIKSESDTLVRLGRQVAAYGRVFDEVSIVVSPRHAEKIMALVPDWWGIVVARGDRSAVALDIVRQTSRNPAPDAYAVAQLLWRDEVLELLTDLGQAGGLRSKPRRALWRALADAMPLADLGDAVRERLRRRCDWRAGPPLPQGDGSSLPESTSSRSPDRQSRSRSR